jgi:hypothetical protein
MFEVVVREPMITFVHVVIVIHNVYDNLLLLHFRLLEIDSFQLIKHRNGLVLNKQHYILLSLTLGLCFSSDLTGMCVHV